MFAKRPRLGFIVTIFFTAASAALWAAYGHPFLTSIFGVGAIFEVVVAMRFWNKPGA